MKKENYEDKTGNIGTLESLWHGYSAYSDNANSEKSILFIRDHI